MNRTVRIRYCTRCRWLLRASWMAQELLTTLDGHIDALILEPGDGGVFEAFAGDQRVWSRQEMEGFPEISELKRRVRDVVAPTQALGHIDRRSGRDPDNAA